MTRNCRICFAVFVFFLSATLVRAQSEEEEKLSHTKLRPRESTAGEDDQWFGLSYRMGFNISAKFNGIGGTGPNPGSTNGLSQHHYNNGGYVNPDALHDDHAPTAPHATWNWGWDRTRPGDGTYNAGANTMTFTATQVGAVPSASGSSNDDPNQGFELSYHYKLGKLGKGQWGVTAAAGWFGLDTKNNTPYTAPIKNTVDTYSLFFPGYGAVNPGTAYSGTYSSGTKNINDAPVASEGGSRTVTSGGLASISGNRELKADLFGFRAGPYIEYPLGKRFFVSADGGVALLFVDSKFSFTENIAGPGLTPSTQTASGKNTDVLVGPYIAADISLKLTSHARIFTGLQFQDLGTYTHTEGGKSAVLDLSDSVFWTIGFGYGF